MRKSDVFRAMFSILYTLNAEVPEEERDPKLVEYLDKYMPNFGKHMPPKDSTVMIKFRKYLDKKCKEDNIAEEEAFDITKTYIKENTDFAEVFGQINKKDWENLCDLINVSNEVNAINAMKEDGTYAEMIRGGEGNNMSDYLREHPEIMDRANPDMAAQAMMTMTSMSNGSSLAMAGEAKPKTIHPNQKKKKKKKKK